MADKVALFKCKTCGVRMFERDCVRHMLQVHRVQIKDAEISARFIRGAKDMAAVPGSDYKPMYYQKQAKRSPAAPAEDDDDLN